MRSCGSLVTFTVCVASLSSEICLAAVWCARARVCVYVPDFYHRVLHRGYQSSTDDIEGICLGHFYVYSSNVSNPGKKTVMCVFSTQQQCVRVFYAFFFLIVKIDSSSIPLINEIAGKKNQSVTCRSMEITVHCRDAPHGNGNLDLAPGWIKVVAWPPLIKIFLDL